MRNDGRCRSPTWRPKEALLRSPAWNAQCNRLLRDRSIFATLAAPRVLGVVVTVVLPFPVTNCIAQSSLRRKSSELRRCGEVTDAHLAQTILKTNHSQDCQIEGSSKTQTRLARDFSSSVHTQFGRVRCHSATFFSVISMPAPLRRVLTRRSIARF